jgi:hypothetical protein
MPDRLRRLAATRVRRQGPWILASALLVALLVTPFAGAFGEGSAVRGGARNPSFDTRRAYTRETQIIADTSTYGTRQSNKSSNGGGAIYGCRSGAGGSEHGNEPCVRASNLAQGRAFEFSTGGAEVGRITSTNANAAPFTTNAGGVATGLNADKVDGHDAADLQPLFAAVDAAGALGGGRGASAARNLPAAAGQFEVDFNRDVSACARTASQTTADTPGAVSTTLVDADTVRVFTLDSTGAAADKPFHLVVTC